ncbi:MAG: single-stranded-DNA-specific exonuclease RecJ [Lachnospiraceae bacterium]|nr:single-stranded-DNA-specific exonuclease RecJ [Lachnospiraceae bacterium]
MAKWMLKQRGGDYKGLGQQFHVNPLLILLLFNRGVYTPEKISHYLLGKETDFYSPSLMKDMDKATAIVANKIREGKKIRIIGDYDIDGIMATAILMKGFSFFGAVVDYSIPHRVKDGYGLNSSLVTKAHNSGVDTIVTCDNGISAKVPIDLAKSYGMTVVVTDHHEVPFHEVGGRKEFLLPAADAVVDPKQQEATYPFAGICGGFVAYKMIESLHTHFMEQCDEKAYEKLRQELTELAAFATIGDIMDLQDENRILVKEGLLRMQRSQNLGLRTLMKVQEVDGKKLSAFHIGFVLGPCINATGRLDSPDRALRLLLTENVTEAVNLATELKELNESRKSLTEEATNKAIEQIESGQHQGQKVLVIYLEDCHESIAGIVAGRIKEKYNRPTLVITKAEDGLKGSARSIEAYHIYDEMTKVSDIFTKYGGHAMAAGFSLPTEKLEELRERLNANCTLSGEDLEGVVHLDAEVPLGYFNAGVLEDLAIMEPCGGGNERPLFVRKGMQFLSAKYLGSGKKVIVFSVYDTRLNSWHELKLFRDIEGFFAYISEKCGESSVQALLNGNTTDPILLDIVYTTGLNEFRGRRSLQYVLEYYR